MRPATLSCPSFCPWDPHLVRSGVRITQAAHREASGRAAHPCSWCSGSQTWLHLESSRSFKSSCRPRHSPLIESEHRSQASAVPKDPMLIPCVATFGHHLLAFLSYSGQYLPLNICLEGHGQKGCPVAPSCASQGRKRQRRFFLCRFSSSSLHFSSFLLPN